MKGPLIALALGVAACLVTREVVVGLLVAAAGWWFFRESLGRAFRRRTGNSSATGYPRSQSPRRHPHRRPARQASPSYNPRDGEGIAVVCKQVTPERQEWVSVKTGRLFDVLSPDGPPDANPGDPGEAFVNGARYTVRAARKIPSET